MINRETAYQLLVYTLMCKKCGHIYYIPPANTFPYKYCPYCKSKLNLEWIDIND